jgi:hypothetical protein
MKYARTVDLNRHRQGSLEARLAAAQQLVRDHLGEDTEMVATHETYAIARTADGRVHEVRYQLTEGQDPEVLITEAADVPVLEGLALDRAAADDLRSVTESLLAGEAIGRDRWHDLARMARKDVTYWVGEALTELEESWGESAWWAYYAPQEPTIRKALHGSIREIESPVPQPRFGKFSEAKVEGYSTELRECLTQLQGVARGLFDDLSAPAVCYGEAMDAIHRSLRQEARDIAETLAWVERMNWTGHFSDVATAHDRLAARLKNALVMQAHLKRATGEQNG